MDQALAVWILDKEILKDHGISRVLRRYYGMLELALQVLRILVVAAPCMWTIRREVQVEPERAVYMHVLN